ncbi:MAG: glycosyltransferase family 9 protein, partial [Bacteroidota bacterium]|nr:glycosyltransferase family 9 protein [Bacteroidota bacterium]
DFANQHKGLKGLYRLYKELKQRKPHRIADIHKNLRTAVLRIFFKLSFTRIKVINKGYAERKRLIHPSKKTMKPLTPQHYRYVEVFTRLGFPIDLDQHEFPFKPALLKSVMDIDLQADRKWIGIAPFAAHPGKVYPLDLMQKVVGYLQQQHSIFLFGHGPKETDQINTWAKAYPHVVSQALELPFSEQLDLIANLDVMLSMDSANGHLAANFNVPVVTLWGMTHPFLGFSPFGQNNHLLADRESFPKIPTSAYGKVIPKGYKDAMRTISPEEVIELVLDKI